MSRERVHIRLRTAEPNGNAVQAFQVRLSHNPLYTEYLRERSECKGIRTPDIPTLSIQAVHHTADKFKLVLKGEVDEICVDKNTVWRNKGSVVG